VNFLRLEENLMDQPHVHPIFTKVRFSCRFGARIAAPTKATTMGTLRGLKGHQSIAQALAAFSLDLYP
jgi:hypothetical protein